LPSGTCRRKGQSSESRIGNNLREAFARQQGAAMIHYLSTWLQLKSDRRGVTAIEYALIGSLIAVAIIAAVTGVGTNVKTTFNTIANNL
jgi:pilus assembly protein Flp/PilA